MDHGGVRGEVGGGAVLLPGIEIGYSTAAGRYNVAGTLGDVDYVDDGEVAGAD